MSFADSSHQCTDQTADRDMGDESRLVDKVVAKEAEVANVDTVDKTCSSCRQAEGYFKVVWGDTVCRPVRERATSSES